MFVEYIGDWGTYADVPLKKIDQIFTEKYPKWYNNPSQRPIKHMNKEPLSLKK
jgi:hypothetical protein